MLRCKSRPRMEELSLAIREGELDFAAAAIRFSEGPESAQGGRIGPISPDAGHPELKARLAKANEGDLIGPFQIGDMHVLLRLDKRITTRLDEKLQAQVSRACNAIDRRQQAWQRVTPHRSTFQRYDCLYILKTEVVAGLRSVPQRRS